MASKTSNKHWSKVNSTYRLKVNFVHNPFQSFMASKTSNKHWSKVNSTYRLKVGNKENEKFEERKKMEFLGKKENRVVPRTFL